MLLHSTLVPAKYLRLGFVPFEPADAVLLNTHRLAVKMPIITDANDTKTRRLHTQHHAVFSN